MTEDLTLVCSCSHLSHAVMFSQNEDTGELYVDVVLVMNRGFWRRLRIAWRYLTGSVCGFGDCAEVIIDEKDRARLKAWVEAATKGPAL